MKLSTEERRRFAASFLPRKPAPTVAQYYRHMNHELWRRCPHCNLFIDLRKSLWNTCPECGKKLQ